MMLLLEGKGRGGEGLKIKKNGDRGTFISRPNEGQRLNTVLLSGAVPRVYTQLFPFYFGN